MSLFISAFALTAVVILLFMTFFYFLSLILQRSDIVDIGWGLGFIFVTISLFLRAPFVTTVMEILTVLVTIWGLRLAIHIFIRNKDKKEDFRYQNLKKQWGKGFWWKSYFKIFLLQGVFMLIISIPLIYAFTFPTLDITWLDYAGIGIWVFGLLFEAIGDYQLSVFISKKKKGKTKSRFLTKGLWSLTRHPNYFGEVVLWWGIWLLTIDLSNLNSLYTIIGPLMISYLIIFVSGVPMLEEKYEGNSEWEKYKERVPKFFPLKLK